VPQFGKCCLTSTQLCRNLLHPWHLVAFRRQPINLDVSALTAPTRIVNEVHALLNSTIIKPSIDPATYWSFQLPLASPLPSTMYVSTLLATFPSESHDAGCPSSMHLPALSVSCQISRTAQECQLQQYQGVLSDRRSWERFSSSLFLFCYPTASFPFNE